MAYSSNSQVKPKRAAVIHSRGVYTSEVARRLKDGELFVDTSGTGMYLGEADPLTGKVSIVQVATTSKAGKGDIGTEQLADGAVTPEKLSQEYLPLSGGQLKGPITISHPTEDSNPATKKYVDDAIAAAGGGGGTIVGIRITSTDESHNLPIDGSKIVTLGLGDSLRYDGSKLSLIWTE